MQITRVIPKPFILSEGAEFASNLVRELTGEKNKAKYLGGGSFGRAFRVQTSDGDFVVKIMLASGMAEKETHDLKLLGSRCPIRFPEVLYTSFADGNSGFDAYVMDTIPGKNALFSIPLFLASKSKRLAFADEVTEALHEIHKFTNPKFGDTLNPHSDTWTEYYRPFAEAVLQHAEEAEKRRELRGEIVCTLRRAMDKFDFIFSEPVTEASLIHGDLNVANIMVDGKKITGFIDPLNSMFADREYDLFQFDNLTGKRFSLCSRYVEKYSSSEKFVFKKAFYALYNEVYCFIRSGALIPLIMNPLVENMLALLNKTE